MQVTGAVTTHSNAVMELTGGAQAKNIFWQVESVYGEVVRAPNNSPVELLRAGQFAVLAKT
eukprot:scaffold6252_cov174-Chaetoceros_neogracile.AAC.1